VADADVKAVDLKPKRKQAGMTQEELASRIGFARETISRVENGKDPMPMLMAVRCAREFGSITVESGGLRFVVTPEAEFLQDGPDKSQRESIPGDEALHDLNLEWALHGRIREGEQLHPHLVQEGLRRALAERPGARRMESDEHMA